MQRIPVSPPQISPIKPMVKRPLWSVMIPAYNCSDFLPEAIESVLIQDLGKGLMQIEVVDDGSTDADVEEIVNRVGKGRVFYYRQKSNVGSLRNFETCINRSQGKYVHLLHGDDRVKSGYYTEITDLFEKFPEVGAAFCSWDNIDGNGNYSHYSKPESDEPCILTDWLNKLAEYPRLQYVAITVKREVYEKLGSFYLANYGEDWEMWARIAKYYSTAYTPKILAEYREHKNSITWRSYQNGQNIKDIAKVTEVIISYLPKKERQKKLRIARKNYIYWIINETYGAWFFHKNKQVAYKQIKATLGTYMDTYVLTRIMLLLLYIWTDPYRRYIKKTLSKL
jgi:glycosyltransferase involved in cell wall biosynthesis